jgi:hypothetical protein
VFIKSKWYSRMTTAPDIFTDREVGRHARIRRLFAPAFNLKNVSSQEQTMQFHLERLVQMARSQKGEEKDLANLLHCYVSDLMFDVVMGMRTDCLCTGELSSNYRRSFGNSLDRRTCNNDRRSSTRVLLGHLERSTTRLWNTDNLPLASASDHCSSRQGADI